METIVAILRAAHCKSTHHFFAIDSLWEVTTPRGIQLADLLLANYSDYLLGAKDPDTLFKDFENHVVHVADGYWGGAAKAGKKWLELANNHLASAKWKEAAYSLGVLSHYFTDPFMPLHTAQSPRETVIHRPLEWSVCCAYQELYQTACANPQLETFSISSGADWLVDAIHGGATYAHQYYEQLLDDYDMSEAGRFPKLALGTDSKRILSQLFVMVHTAWGSALDRIANDTTISFPKSALTLPTLLAGIQMPKKKLAQALESAEQRKQVENILDEYQQTGCVVRNLPDEQRKVRTIREQKPTLRPPAIEIARVASAKTTKPQTAKPVAKPAAMPVAMPVAMPATMPNQPRARAKLPEAPKFARKSIAPPERIPTTVRVPVLRSKSDDSSRKPIVSGNRLTVDCPIVDAPAIGPKTAARFHSIGCNTVGDFLERDAHQLAIELNTSWITGKLVSQWQDQATLACQIENLTAIGAGLLVMAGIHSAEELVHWNPNDLHSELVSLSKTNEGKRLTREQPPPAPDLIQKWSSSARSIGINASPIPT